MAIQISFELSLEFGAIVHIQNLSHFVGFKTKLDREYILSLKRSGLKVFKLADSNKAPNLVLMYDFLEFIKHQSCNQ